MSETEEPGTDARAGQRKGRPPRRERRIPAAGPAPTEGLLHEAALNHLARFAATEAGLVRVLQRRVARWAQRAEREGQPPDSIAPAVVAGRMAAEAVAKRMAGSGAVDDAAFATARVRRLSRVGRSRRAIEAHLRTKGVGGTLAGETLDAAETDEVAAALASLRRRRAGPFAADPPEDPEAARAARMKAMGALARAGFPRDVAEAALDVPPEEAEARLIAARRG